MSYLEFSENLSDHKSTIRKEYRARSSEGLAPSRAFENQIWRLFCEIGFSTLNIGNEVVVTFGRSKDSTDSKRVDVFAESSEARIYVECTTQSALTQKIKAWIQEASEIMKYDVGAREKKNRGFIFASKEEVGEADRERLSRAGITVFGPKEIEFFSRLATRYSRLAYYQLLSFVFRSKRIESIDDSEIAVPAIRSKYGSKGYCYLFAVHPATLIPISMVMHRSSPTLDDDEAYQRLVKPSKIRAIKKHIREQGGVFPTNVIISFESSGPNSRFKADKKQNELVKGILTLPNKFGAISVIDGQHRLFAYDETPEAESHLIYVVAFENMPLSAQIQVFVDINANQTKVPASLMWDLLTTLDPTDSEAVKRKVKVARVAKALNTKGGALHGRLDYESAPHSDFGSKVSLESFCTTLRALDVSKLDESELYKWLALYFDSIGALSPEHWNRDDKKDNFLCSNQGVGALLMLFDYVIDHVGHRDVTTASLNPLVGPVTTFANTMTVPEIRALKKGSSEANKKEILKKLAAVVRAKVPTFATELHEEQVNQDFAEILSQVRASGETEVIEVKEAFLVNTKAPVVNGNATLNDQRALDGILKTIVAMSNGFGGKIVVGVVDGTWEVRGIDDTDLKICANDKDAYRKRVLDKINSGIENIVATPEITFCKGEGGGTCIVLSVSPLPTERFERRSPCLLRTDHHAYKRDGSSSVLLTPDKYEDWFNFVREQAEIYTAERESQN